MLRIVSVWHRYREIAEISEEIEHIEDTGAPHVHSPKLRQLCVGEDRPSRAQWGWGGGHKRFTRWADVRYSPFLTATAKINVKTQIEMLLGIYS